MKRHIALPFLVIASASTALSAQEITKEITIEREIVPEVRAASRISLPVSVISPTVTPGTLSFSERAVTSRVPAMITTLDPASAGDAVEVSPFRGYVSAGYFPAVNAGVSAGYRIVSTPSTVLGAWLQYDGNSYSRKVDKYDDRKIKLSTQTVSFGADFSHRFRNSGVVTVDAGFMYDRFNCPWVVPSDSVMGVTRYNVSASWHDRIYKFSYSLEAGVSGISYNHPSTPQGYAVKGLDDNYRYTGPVDPVGTHEIGFNAALNLGWKCSSKATVTLLASVETYNRNVSAPLFYDIDYDKFVADEPQVTVERVMGQHQMSSRGFMTFSPGVDFRGKSMTGRLGASVYVTTGHSPIVNFAPDLSFTWKPYSFIGLGCRYTSDYSINSLGEIYDISRYFLPYGAFTARAFVPLLTDFSVVVGPFRGASLKLHASYSIADDWLMPEAVDGINRLHYDDVNGWTLGACLNYSFRDLLKAKVDYSFVPESHRFENYLWRDRATGVLDVSVDVAPVERLGLSLGYTLRYGRKIPTYRVNTDPYYFSALVYSGTVDLGNVNNLSIGAHYDFTDAFSVFGRLENLLAQRSCIFYDIPSQGVSGLFGVSYKF